LLFYPIRYHVGADTGRQYYPRSATSNLVRLARIVRGPLAPTLSMTDVVGWKFLVCTRVCTTDMEGDAKPENQWHSVASKILEGLPPERSSGGVTRADHKLNRRAQAANQHASARGAAQPSPAEADADATNSPQQSDDEEPRELEEVPL
jgi:hypothetical protein